MRVLSAAAIFALGLVFLAPTDLRHWIGIAWVLAAGGMLEKAAQSNREQRAKLDR